MPLNLRCATPGCPKNLEHRGGEFVYSREDSCFYCKDCFSVPKVMNDCKELYQFSTTHLNGERIEVRGKQHLMRLERAFGVSHQQLNNYERNWDRAPERSPEPMNPEMARLVAKGNEMRFGRAEIGGGFRER